MKFDAVYSSSPSQIRRDILDGSAKELIDPDTMSNNIRSSHGNLLIYKIV